MPIYSITILYLVYQKTKTSTISRILYSCFRPSTCATSCNEGVSEKIASPSSQKGREKFSLHSPSRVSLSATSFRKRPKLATESPFYAARVSSLLFLRAEAISWRPMAWEAFNQRQSLDWHSCIRSSKRPSFVGNQAPC